ncbi:zf-HC2 domain-containing protein [Dehalococcoidia bacterium]|nr:zf-HC2 domain-containing protein [Dehalococcoidia bacterium]MCL0048780.1 zf-HC2 domain-containing protein [Dehalococcoidia bacterium]MCL0059037.1 zf-HC2 domain-containing protein [Dehalococcoidia bacterium]MCL0078249.1 zf-HC2 domain-containing protein [Dehalococcoidia bacterium]MCL0089084.1 zf-HC2 domain-containing protein [Dehalococcoidia bacterium]
MMDCIRANELMPWYANNNLPSEEAWLIADHLVNCPACREELRWIIRMAREHQADLEQMPGLTERTWNKVVARTRGLPVVQVNMGHSLLGLSLRVLVEGRGIPMRGDLFLLGYRAPLFAFEAV